MAKSSVWRLLNFICEQRTTNFCVVLYGSLHVQLTSLWEHSWYEYTAVALPSSVDIFGNWEGGWQDLAIFICQATYTEIYGSGRTYIMY